MNSRTALLLLTLAPLACGNPCRVDIMDEACPATTSTSTATTDAEACLAIEPAHPFGPCESGCSSYENICYGASDNSGNVCAKTCLSDEVCDAVPYCTPDDAPSVCKQGWCVVDCAAASCPSGMTCDPATAICVWPYQP